VGLLEPAGKRGPAPLHRRTRLASVAAGRETYAGSGGRIGGAGSSTCHQGAS
jgi:hypothetical protein